MTCTTLVRPLSAVTWELRRAWASGRRVALSLERCDMDRVEGVVTRVSSSGALARVRGLHVPTDRILAVHWPSVVGDGERQGKSATPMPDGKGRAIVTGPGQTELVLP